MKGIPKTTVWYCKVYGDMRAKPTDIWSISYLFFIYKWVYAQKNINGQCLL